MLDPYWAAFSGVSQCTVYMIVGTRIVLNNIILIWFEQMKHNT